MRYDALVRSAILAGTLGLCGCALDFDAIGFATGGEGGVGASGPGSTATAASASTASAASTSAAGGDCVALGGQCVDPETGWEGPFVRADGFACPNGLTRELLAGMSPSAPPCPCDLDDQPCSLLDVMVYSSASCSNNALATLTPGPPNVCTSLATLGATGVVMPSGTSNSGGSCALAGAAPDPLLTAPVSLCSSPSTCGGGQVCVPAGELACVYQVGGGNCPPGYEDAQTLTTAKVTCRACGAPSQVDCSGKLVVFDPADSSCAGMEVAEFPIAAGCTSYTFPQETPSVYKPMEPGVCASATGALSGEQPVTICCPAAG